MSKYQLLSEHFRRLPGEAWQATFEEIERIVGFRLPDSARAHQAWRANSTDHMPRKAAWMDTGWRTRDLNLTAGHVLFVRETGAVLQLAVRGSPAGAGGPGAAANEAHEWDTASAVNLCLELAWVPIGRMVVDEGGKRAVTTVAALPGHYRSRIRQGASEKGYIGQSENLAQHFGHYTDRRAQARRTMFG